MKCHRQGDFILYKCICISEPMDCESDLFAESDEDVQVIPAQPEAPMPQREPAPRVHFPSTPPSSPSAVLSESPHPPAPDTPVPEEYQPLPDNSNSGYVFGNSNNNNNGANGDDRFVHCVDVNIRYQPKPRSYFQATFTYTPGYTSNPYQSSPIYNNAPALNFLRRGVPYVVPPRAWHARSVYEQMNPPNFNQSHQFTIPTNSQPADQPINLKRPSRKLNISPRHRHVKQEANGLSTIEISSEEEDNGQPRNEQGIQIPSSSSVKVENSEPVNNLQNQTIRVKQEPTAQVAAEDSEVGNVEPNLEPSNVRHSHNNYSHSENCPKCVRQLMPQVKKESDAINNNYIPNRVKCEHPQESPSTSMSTQNVAQIKEERPPVKQESNPGNSSNLSDPGPSTSQEADSTIIVKVENVCDNRSVTQNASALLSNVVDSITIKREDRIPPTVNEVDAAGDRQITEPWLAQPGTSSGITRQTSVINFNKV